MPQLQRTRVTRLAVDARTVADLVIGAAALWMIAAGLCWGTLAAGGADSYGYISQASLWLRGNLIVDQPIARTVPWPDADWTFSPLGYRPGLENGTIVPIFPAGLPIVMALLQGIAGPRAVFLAVPLLGAAIVLATARLATRMWNPAAGAVAALLVAFRPAVLSSLMWPMSDVPAAAWWALALFLATGAGVPSAAGSGLATALAILTRPNLVGLAVAPAMYFAVRIRQTVSDRPRAIARLEVFTVLSMLGCLAVAAIHTRLYGSPFKSGYGDVSRVYSLSQIPASVPGLASHPLRFEPILLLLGLAGAVALVRRRGRADVRATAGLAIGMIGLVLLSYAFYPPSPDWWYLRFLLPAYPALAALGGAGTLCLAELAPTRWRMLVVSVVCACVVMTGLWEAADRGVFEFRNAESRYATVAGFVVRSLPPNAAFLAFQQSAGLRHYAGRMTLRFDLLQPKWFDTAITKMRARGYRPYVIVEEPEMELFKARFRDASVLGNLDWPPVAELPRPVRVQIFDPADRGKWRAGRLMSPQRIFP